jgi:uncharacterized protein (TIGR03435 family)
MRVIVCVLLTAGLSAQTAQFEAASMKIVPPGTPFRARTVDGAQIHYPSVSLLMLLREAYRVQTRDQIVGPPWMRTQAYDILAKLPPNTSKDQIPDMLQGLLAERLKLVVHHETRPTLTNVLLAGKKEPKMRRAVERDDELQLKLDVPQVHLSGRGSIAMLIDQLHHGLGGPDPWIDETGIGGFFEIKLEFQLGSGAAAPPGDFSAGPTLTQALESQLGLRVETKRAPADFLVVDRVEKNPVEN